jgi:hypothetical protein
MQIENYPNYKIYANGNVENIKTGRILKQILGNHGYLVVCLRNNAGQKLHIIHRLLGKYYIPNPNNYPCIDHIDRNRTNNMLINLRWCSHQQNNMNKSIYGESEYRGVDFKKKNKKWRAQITINKKNKHIGLYNTEIEAAKAFNKYILDHDMNEFYRENLNIIPEE